MDLEPKIKGSVVFKRKKNDVGDKPTWRGRCNRRSYVPITSWFVCDVPSTLGLATATQAGDSIEEGMRCWRN